MVIVLYKSVTGFTKEYAEYIAKEIGGKAISITESNTDDVREATTIVFGGRLHAGRIEGLSRGKQLFEESTANQLIVFATGAMPMDATDDIEKVWSDNGIDERIPHFYLPGGLRYDRMPWGEKLLMKTFATMMSKRPEMKEIEASTGISLKKSYSLFDPIYAKPLIEHILSNSKASS